MSELINVGLGSLQGSGVLNILNPVTNEYVDIPAYWGLSLGVYLSICAIVLVSIAAFLDIRYGEMRKDKV